MKIPRRDEGVEFYRAENLIPHSSDFVALPRISLGMLVRFYLGEADRSEGLSQQQCRYYQTVGMIQQAYRHSSN